MIELPWQIVASFLGLVAVHMVVNYLRKSDCDERIETAKRQQHRDTMAIYREAFRIGLDEGYKDGNEHAKRPANGNGKQK